MISLLLLVAAAVCFLLAVLGYGGRDRTVPLGLFLAVLALIVERI